MGEMNDRRLVTRADRYLDYHNQSDLAHLHVIGVLQKFEFLVELAFSRAIEALELPPGIEDSGQLATVLQFRHDRINPGSPPTDNDPLAS